MESGQSALAVAAAEGTLISEEWPQALKYALYRIDHNTFHEFAIPLPVPPSFTSSSLLDPSATSETIAIPPNTSSEDSHKENAPPSSPPVAPETSSPPHTPRPETAAKVADTSPKLTLPPQLQATYDYVKETLTTNFSNNPPHTIQRLAELVLYPRQHHRFLHSYLNALDRVVSVTSGAQIFPLPAVEVKSASGPLANGTPAAGVQGAGADENLGGPLLTPIPWLRNGSSSPSSGAGLTLAVPPGGSADEDMIDTSRADTADSAREGGAVTQGELLRLEQEHSAPPAPVASLTSRHQAGPVADHGLEAAGAPIEDPDQPHARGPEAIDMTDTGPQEHALGVGQTLDMEAAVGRAASLSRSPEEPKLDVNASGLPDNPIIDAVKPPKKDGDGDVEVTDVDGMTDEQKEQNEITGDTAAPDAVDATAR